MKDDAMTCREFVAFIDRHLTGELSTLERLSFSLHVALCRNCTNYLRTYKQTIVVSKAAFTDPDAQVPSSVPEELVAAILAARRARP
jgi:hypothetical protein